MVFKKPYAFFIKYFRLIHLILTILLIYLSYSLNNLHGVLREIYLGTYTSYGVLKSTYINFKLGLTIFLILLLISSIISLFIRKKKPLRDYILCAFYIVVIIIYLFLVNNLFGDLLVTSIEQTTLNLYSDISLMIIIPALYFIFMFAFTTIGFNLKKFNFSKDIEELKQEESDNEEVEVIFNKNTYKYKRSIRKYIRELKYYYIENRGLINTVCLVLIGILIIFSVSKFTFSHNTYKLGKQFSAGGFTFKINDVYETEYDLNENIVKKDYKYIIANVDIKNNKTESQKFDFSKMRIVFGDNFSYANNYFNDKFMDMGIPYNKTLLNAGETYNYLFIFEVPKSYKKHSYKIKIYDQISYKDDEMEGVYKIVKFKSKKIDKKKLEVNNNMKEKVTFGENYGSSSITVNSYLISNSYTYTEKDCKDDNDCIERTRLITPNSANNVLLILDYNLSLDSQKNISKVYKNDIDFFKAFFKIEYELNGNIKTAKDITVLNKIDNKLFISIPYELKNSTKLNMELLFRDTEIKIKLK